MLQLIQKHGQKLGGRAASQALAAASKAKNNEATLQQSLDEMTQSEPASSQDPLLQAAELVTDTSVAAQEPCNPPILTQNSSILAPVTPRKPSVTPSASLEERGHASDVPSHQQYHGHTDGIACSTARHSSAADLQPSLEHAPRELGSLEAVESATAAAVQQSLAPEEGMQIDQPEGMEVRPKLLFQEATKIFSQGKVLISESLHRFVKLLMSNSILGHLFTDVLLSCRQAYFLQVSSSIWKT